MTRLQQAALSLLLAASALSLSACGNDDQFVARNPASGPGELVGLAQPLNTTFGGGASPDIQPRSVGEDPDWTNCDGDCQAYCASLPFENPVDEAMCPHLWGVGLDTRPVNDEQACRRIFADLTGQFPTYSQIESRCLGRPIGAIVEELIESEFFVFQNQRLWADKLRYNNVAINLERIYDADLLVGKLYRGLLRYDRFIEVASAHPVLVRRFDNAADRAEALFNIFVGRPPFENERADMSKLYNLWSNGYFDHPDLGMRLPDAFVEHKCLTEDGTAIDENTAGACTSVLWGFNRVILLPDFRSTEGERERIVTWSENLTPEEWELLQTPGKVVATWPVVWEHAVEDVLKHYLGYDIAQKTPRVVEQLVEYVLQHQGDIRAAHYAVLTSQLYLQSTECAGSECANQEDYPRWTYGPFRQAEAEMWIDSIGAATSEVQGACDHRLPVPQQLLQESPIGYEVVQASRWSMDKRADEPRVDTAYSSFAQTLGGCPDNEVAGRFKAISILSTATQEAFVGDLCGPANTGGGVAADILLPSSIGPADALSESAAEAIIDFQVKRFFSRPPLDAELAMARETSQTCTPAPCSAEAFARASCYALLSSSEMLFY